MSARAITLLAVAALLIGAAPAHAAGSLPAPACGANDNAKGLSGVDGQVSLGDRASGRWMTAYNCNLELVGQEIGEGASWQTASYDTCTYYDTSGGSNMTSPGTRVVDVRDPAHPKTTEILHTPAMDDPWESLKVNHRRGLLAGVENAGPGFSIYDVTKDCRHPVHLASIETVETDGTGHAGAFAPDGLTYYGSTNGEPYAIDIRDPSHPKDFFRWTMVDGAVSHDVALSDDGNRMYVAGEGRAVGADTPLGTSANGLQIWDVSQIQQRRGTPEPKVIGKVYWTDGGVSQEAIPVRIGGRPFVVYTDELGPYGIEDQAGRARACAQGLPPYGMVRLIDIADETKPKVASKLMLEVNDPDNCASTIGDNSGEALFSYDVHYCNVDDVTNVKLVACGHFQSGIRVFDVSDPEHPHNVAYYVPPAATTATGSNFNAGAPGVGEWAGSKPQFHNGNELWVSTMNNGFQALRFTNGTRFTTPSSDEVLATAPARDARPAPLPPVSASCRHSLTFRLKPPRGQRLRSAKVYVNNRRVKTLKGKSLRRPVKLRGLNRRAVEVRTVMITRSGRRISRTKLYRLCG